MAYSISINTPTKYYKNYYWDLIVCFYVEDSNYTEAFLSKFTAYMACIFEMF